MVYGDPQSAETYEGERDYESMSKFAKEHISRPICSIYRKENCSKEEQKIIADIEAKTDEELLAITKEVEELVTVQEHIFDVEVTKIQQKYDEMVEAFNNELEGIKEKYNYKYLEQIISLRELIEDEEYEEEEGGEL